MLLLLTAVVSAGATGSGLLLQPGCTIDGTTVSLPSRALPEGTVINADIDGIPVEAALTAQGTEPAPITYYCLVEASTILSNHQIQQRTAVLNAISEAMRPEDSMVIAALGSSLTLSEPLTTAEARQEAIAGIEKDGRESALYDTIAETLKALEESDSLSCLVLLSDGIDSGKEGTTADTLLAQVSESSIPVCTIGLLNISVDLYASTTVRRITQLAEASVGGFSAIPTIDKTDPAGVGAAVCQAMLDRSLITVSFGAIPANGQDRVLTLSCEVEGAQYTSAVTIPADAFPADPAEETTVPESTTHEDEEQKGIPYLVWICVAAFIVLAIALAALLLLRKKKPEVHQEDLGVIMDDTPPSVLPDFTNNGVPNVQEYYSSSQYQSELSPSQQEFLSADDFAEENPISLDAFSSTAPLTPPVPAQRLLNVSVLGVSNTQFRMEFQMYKSQSVTLGRNRNASVILNANDARLSGQHMELEWDGEDVYIRDKKSTNGTHVNGTPMKPEAWFPLNSGDIVRAGANDYQFIFQ